MKCIIDQKGSNMKKLFRIFTLVTLLSIVFILFPGKISAQQRYMNYQGFYDQLSPYGQWVENPDYGYVWIPDEGSGFTPYLSNGYWAPTDYGWMWVSNYNWGWAPFHYGRWDYSNYYGWFWVPDNEWGPSWVIWRSSGNYYGWAPMRPGISINVAFGNNYNNEPNDRWVFVRNRDFERHDIDRNYIDRSNNVTIINNSTVINNTYYDNSRQTTYITGPGRHDVEKVTGRSIKPFKVHEKDKPGEIVNKDQIQIYRPEVHKNKNGNRLAPTKVTNIKDVKRIPERKTEKQPQDKQILKDRTGKDRQPVINPRDKNNTNDNTRQKQNTNSTNKNIKKEQKPVINPRDKNNTNNNTLQKRNTNSTNKNIKKEQKPVINPREKNNTNNNIHQNRNADSLKTRINKEKQPVVNKNNSKENSNKPPKKK
jgi:hypothetical protein